MDINIKQVKKELKENAEKGATFRGLIEYIKYRYYGTESIPAELIGYALELPTEITIIGCRPKQAGGAGC
ncbi:MAG: hypothetical protein IKD59_09175 [Lachnospiraceae bacterium]|nr:hypothetical protein [Lachnospiraceae bacterium]MBR3182775.1 hypothetical protein [Bacillota bacterium]MBR3374211.1 hypothetical protein [Bacillota bacterium]